MRRKTKHKRKSVEAEQPYKVGKPFVEWLDSQIAVMENHITGSCRCEMTRNDAELETYIFIRDTIVKQ